MRQRLFDRLALLTCNRPWLVLAAAVILAGAAGALSGRLKMETRILDLLPRDEPSAVEFNKIVQKYDSASQVMIGIEGADRKHMTAFADALEDAVKQATYTDKTTGEKKPYAKRITVKMDEDYLAEHGLMLTKKRDLENIEELFSDLKLAPLLEAYNDFFEREYIEDSGSVTEREKEDNAIAALKNIVTWLEGVETVDKGGRALSERATRVADLLSVGETYLFSEDDSMLLVSVTPAVSIDLLDETIEGVTSLRTAVENALGDNKDVTFRMAGMPVIMMEEAETVMDDMGIGTVLSLLLVLAVFIVAFRMWTAPMSAVTTLIIGIIWTSGFVAITIGRLNLMTFMFAVILIGLGIDFAIHLNAAFSGAAAKGKSLGDSLKEMYRIAGPGVMTGALTTAAAFLALTLTGLDAMIELGVVLGAGILFTLAASLTVLPALYTIHYRISCKLRKGPPRPKPVYLSFSFLGAFGRLIQKRPWPVLIVFVAVTAALGFSVRNAAFEPDMLEIEPPDMKSVTLQRDIIKKFELHPDFAMVTSESLEETRKMTEQLKKNRLVGRVDAVSEFVPSKAQQEKRARIVKRIGARMAEISESGNAPSTVTAEEKALFLKELDRLQMNIQEMGQLAFASVKKRLQRTADRISGGKDKQFSLILGLKNRLEKTSELERKMAAYQDAYIPLLAKRLEKMANPAPLTFEGVPKKIRDRYMSDDGMNLVTIYSSVDLWLEGKTELFLKATKRASDRVTGTAVLMVRLITLIGEKGLMATALALGTVFLILLIDFRGLGFAVLGMLPLLTGFVWMMGIFVLMERKFDVVNVTALPLILGIGIDNAVHVLHAVRRKGTPALPEVLAQTGRALLLAALTTGIAFGSIAVSSHRGMAGMGLLLVLGVAACFVASAVLLPALTRIVYSRSPSTQKANEKKEGAR